jgi:hypothetical protein
VRPFLFKSCVAPPFLLYASLAFMPTEHFGVGVTGKVSLALPGCGTVTREFRWPAAMVDTDRKRAETLRRSFGLNCRLTADYKPILTPLDGVVNALPKHLHAAATLEVLHAGQHVLCEKPWEIATDSARLCCQTGGRERQCWPWGCKCASIPTKPCCGWSWMKAC